MKRLGLLGLVVVLAMGCGGKPTPPAREEVVQVKEEAKIEKLLEEVNKEVKKREKEKEEPLTDWVPLGKDARLEDVTIRLDEAKVGKVKSKDDQESAEDFLRVKITVTNHSKTRRIIYKQEPGWMQDEFKNQYRSIFSFDRPAGAAETDSLYPGKQLSDVIIYEIPVEAATRLDWKVPGERLGVKGTFRFRVTLQRK